jgi:hypothetical protein
MTARGSLLTGKLAGYLLPTRHRGSPSKPKTPEQFVADSPPEEGAAYLL